MTASLRDIRVYTTFPHPCSYLDNEEATTLFIDPRQTISPDLYTQLSQTGFRRSGDHVYRPHCARCNACIPCRVPVAAFTQSKSQKRVWNRNQDLTMMETPGIFDDEAFTLYQRYIEARHADGDMYPPERDQYESFLNNGLGCTRYFRFYHSDQLIAVLVTDEMEDGLSAIYTFYDPEQEQRSLGTYGVLYQIALTQSLGLDYLYLGYWIQNSDKMNYKARFRPLEIFTHGRWQHRDRLPTEPDMVTRPLRFNPPR